MSADPPPVGAPPASYIVALCLQQTRQVFDGKMSFRLARVPPQYDRDSP